MISAEYVCIWSTTSFKLQIVFFSSTILIVVDKSQWCSIAFLMLQQAYVPVVFDWYREIFEPVIWNDYGENTNNKWNSNKADKLIGTNVLTSHHLC